MAGTCGICSGDWSRNGRSASNQSCPEGAASASPAQRDESTPASARGFGIGIGIPIEFRGPIPIATPIPTSGTWKTKEPQPKLRLKLLIRRRPTLPRRCQRSTIGAGGLNFRVRDGNGCDPSAKVTGKSKGHAAGVRRSAPDNQITSLLNFRKGKFYGQASRPISTGKLRALPRFHTQPIAWWSSRGLQDPYGSGYLILGWVSRLYAFSVYTVRT